MMKISERLRASIPGIRGKIVRGETRYGANPEEVNRLTEIEAAVFEVGAALAELLEERLPLPGEPKHEDTTTVEHRGLSPCVTCGHAAAQHGGFGCEVLDHDDPTGTCPCRTYVYYFTSNVNVPFFRNEEPVCTCGHPVSSHDFLRNGCAHYVEGKRCECLGFLQYKQDART